MSKSGLKGFKIIFRLTVCNISKWNILSCTSRYQARSNCFRYGGDLAKSSAVLNVTTSTWPGKDKFLVGLKKDNYIWSDTGGMFFFDFLAIINT